MMNKSLSASHIDPLQISNVYNKAVDYLRQSHASPDTKNVQEIFDQGDSDVKIIILYRECKNSRFFILLGG